MAKPRITNKLPQFVGRVQVAAARGMTQALILGASEAASMTPIDTSTLINSEYKRVEARAGRIVGTVGYTAEYALAVHEAPGKLKGTPRPDNHGKYWGPAGEPQFLKKGFEQAEPHIRAVLIGAIKTA
ncbi:MAG: hypothetical protein JWP93_2333 [Polaromonas sp.]|nr:hypothetical protein [Polaromonas sp.]